MRSRHQTRATLRDAAVAQHKSNGERSALGARRGCFTKVTDRKLFVIEHQAHGFASRQINRAHAPEALTSSPDASVSGGSPSRCSLAPMPLVCETASVQRESEISDRAGSRSPRASMRRSGSCRRDPGFAGLALVDARFVAEELTRFAREPKPQRLGAGLASRMDAELAQDR